MMKQPKNNENARLEGNGVNLCLSKGVSSFQNFTASFIL